MTHVPRQDPVNALFYDGVCGLCNKTVRFIVKCDRRDRFRFAPLQSSLARETLVKHGKDPDALDTLYLVVNYDSAEARVLAKSRAVLRFCAILGWPWKLALALSIVPAPILDFLYDRIAAARYRLFGKSDACQLPSDEDRHKFLTDELGRPVGAFT